MLFVNISQVDWVTRSILEALLAQAYEKQQKDIEENGDGGRVRLEALP